RGLARTAKRPGRTQTLNFYAVDDRLALVDLPGYGYAEVPERIRAAWGPMIEGYLNERSQLHAVILLVDARHGPTRDDVSFWEWLAASRLTPLAVATKWDKLKRSEEARRLKEIKAGLATDQVIP